MLVMGCKEVGRIDLFDESISAPQQVYDISVTPSPGGAIIKYKLPKDKNLQHVKVVYERNGEVWEKKASKYVDSLVIEGYGNTEPREAILYAVAPNGKMSEPISIPFTPLTPSVQFVDVIMEETFGGVKFKLSGNLYEDDLSLVMLVDTVLSDNGLEPGKIDWKELYTFHTSADHATFLRNGLDGKEKLYGYYLRDRWGNISDTLYNKLTPLDEYKLPTNTWKQLFLPGDDTSIMNGGGTVFSYLIDDNNKTNYRTGVVHCFTGMTLTIDLGYVAKISRYWFRGNDPYTGRDTWWWQLYGSMNPNPDGSMDDTWYMLDDRYAYKPSGYTGENGGVGTITTEDRNWYNNVFEYSLSVPAEGVENPQREFRYLRIWFRCSFTDMGSDMSDLSNLMTDRFEVSRFALFGVKVDE